MRDNLEETFASLSPMSFCCKYWYVAVAFWG